MKKIGLTMLTLLAAVCGLMAESRLERLLASLQQAAGAGVQVKRVTIERMQLAQQEFGPGRPSVRRV